MFVVWQCGVEFGFTFVGVGARGGRNLIVVCFEKSLPNHSSVSVFEKSFLSKSSDLLDIAIWSVQLVDNGCFVLGTEK